MTSEDIDNRIKELEDLIQQAEARLEDHQFDVFLIEFTRKWKAELLLLDRQKEHNKLVRQWVSQQLAESTPPEETKKPLLSDDTRLLIGVLLVCGVMYILGLGMGLNA